jgi:ubiquinone biosynthesis protein UbiJ
VNDKLTTWRVLDVVMGLLLTVVTGLVGWNLKMTVAHGQIIASIQGNRFTSEHGLEVWREIARIREQLAMMPREVPPKWFIEDVKELKNTINSIDNRLRRIETRMPPQ